MALITFGKKKAEAKTGQPAPGTSIYYDPNLIAKYLGDHRQLFEIYEQISSALASHNFSAVKRGLNDFRSGLQEHLLSENVKLYVYLSRQLAANEESSRLINEFRTEMNGIGRVVMDFVRKYTEGELGEHQVAAFKREFDEIGAVLKRRTKREESTLYPLYMESY